MSNFNLRNALILLVAVIAALLILGFVSTILNQLIPITVALIVGLVLGRMSVRVDLLAALKNILRREAQPQTVQKPAAVEMTDDPDEVQEEVEAIKQRIGETETPEPETEDDLSDFVIKTEEQILAEARRREQEIARKNNEYDPAAALEERRRRLLGDKADS